MANFYKKMNKRKIEERSHLTLEFPQTDNRVIRTYIPMLENPTITETGKANLATYKLLGRANALHAYMGAESRKFNLTFRITFLHLLEHLGTEGLADHFQRQFSLFYTGKDAAIKSFFAYAGEGGYGPFHNNELTPNVDPGKSVEHGRTHRAYYQEIARLKTGGRNFFDNAVDGLLDVLGEFEDPKDDMKDMNTLIDIVLSWVNLIRSTTLNNARDTTQGPPIVRVTHGPLYNNIPCVTEGYDIKIVEEAGYDINTLLPKQLEISLNLAENRTGDFGAFKAGEVTEGDNLAGWEGILGDNNTDPYNGLITLRGGDEV